MLPVSAFLNDLSLLYREFRISDFGSGISDSGPINDFHSAIDNSQSAILYICT